MLLPVRVVRCARRVNTNSKAAHAQVSVEEGQTWLHYLGAICETLHISNSSAEYPHLGYQRTLTKSWGSSRPRFCASAMHCSYCPCSVVSAGPMDKPG